MKNRHVTVCKEIRGQMRTRQIPMQSWKMMVGKMGANGWKECIPATKAVENFPELKQAETKQVEVVAEVVVEAPKEKHTYESLINWPMKELVTLGGIGMKKKEVIIEHILKNQ